jgi:hypothetical protein
MCEALLQVKSIALSLGRSLRREPREVDRAASRSVTVCGRRRFVSLASYGIQSMYSPRVDLVHSFEFVLGIVVDTAVLWSNHARNPYLGARFADNDIALAAYSSRLARGSEATVPDEEEGPGLPAGWRSALMPV